MADLVPQENNNSLEEISPEQIEKNVNDALINIMKVPPSVLQEANALAKQYRIKHGLNATIPMLCKAHECPFYHVCQIPEHMRVAGTRCLQETAAMVSRFESLCAELNITEEDQVDMGLVKDVVDIEIMLMRSDNRLAIDGDIIKDYFATTDVHGKKHFKEDVNYVVNTKMQLMEKKMKLLEKLYATRKDKAEEMKKKKDSSVKSAALMAKMQVIQQTREEMKKKKEDTTEEIYVEAVTVEVDEDIEL